MTGRGVDTQYQQHLSAHSNVWIALFIPKYYQTKHIKKSLIQIIVEAEQKNAEAADH